MKYRSFALLVLLCVAAIAAAGCTGLSQSSGQSAGTERVQVSTAEAKSVGSYSGDYLSDNGAVAASASSGTVILEAAADQKIIKTASVSIEVSDVPSAAEALKSLATGKGGYISSTSVQKISGDRFYGTVVVRVPAAAFDDTLAGIKSLGTVRSVSAQSSDVTEEYTDLVAQKTSYQNQLAQYNAIMKKAEKVEDVITVQQQIDRVQTALDRLEGRLKYLDNRVDLSTITVNLQEPEPVGGETGHSFVAAINEGIAGFLGMIDALIVLVFTILPLLVIGAAGYGIYRWRKGKTPKAAAPAPESKDPK